MLLNRAIRNLSAKYALACLVIIVTTFSSRAQVQANFSADKTGGCSPLTVNFSNTSSGIASTASYQWDFGNGNISTLKDPAAIFTQEQIYTVILIVTQDGKTSSRTMDIEVYKKPEVEFSADIVEGCYPLDVVFTADAKAGSGSVNSYFWDFGDGFTSNETNSSVTHTYNHKQPASVNLTVKNNYGCHTTVGKKDFVNVLSMMSADFEADNNVLCLETDQVKFINKSRGPGTLSYLWDFGDGQTSTEINPSYTFNKKGTYSVKLTVNSSEGCVVSNTKTDLLNVANYSTEMQMPATVCKDATINFIAKYTTAPDKFEWEIDGITENSFRQSLSKVFYEPGSHLIKLTASYGNCLQTVSRPFTVHNTPEAAGFLIDIKNKCGAPTLVDLIDTSKDAVRWEWDYDHRWFEPGIDAKTKKTSFTYDHYMSHTVLLRTFNKEGCSLEQFGQVNTYGADVTIQRANTLAQGDFVACGPSSLDFKVRTSENIIKYKWFFGDTAISTEAAPTFSFSAIRSYGIKLEYETDQGCKGTAYYPFDIQIRTTLNTTFESISGTVICGNSRVLFETTDARWHNSERWYINGEYAGYSSYNSFEYHFSKPGKHTIQLISDNWGCSDTITKVDYIEVLPPFIKLNEPENSCVDRGDVFFTQSSRDVEKLHWDFGDGQSVSLNSNEPAITHNYAASGKYMVTLTVTNGECSLKDSIRTYVLLKPSPLLSATATEVCPNEPFDFTLSNLPESSYEYVWVYYNFEKIEYSDGTPFSGTNNSWQDFVHPLPYTGQLTNLDPSKSGLRMILKENYFECYDTTNIIPLKINGTKAGFKILNNDVCFNTPIRIEDTSYVNAGNSILRWEWSFGDGQKLVRQQGGVVNHVYKNPGNYSITLKLTDAAGCVINSSQSSQQVKVNGPKAAFSANKTIIPANSIVQFNNTSNDFSNYRAVYNWNFGDGTSSTEHAPEHFFTAPGKYQVVLTATDLVTGCTSTAKREITVQPLTVSFNFSKSFVGQTNCLPLLTNFSVVTSNTDSLSWDFGDGTTAGDLRNASKIYDKPGRYIITLTARGTNGDILKYIDSVVIAAIPEITLTANELEGCPGETINWNLSASGAKTFIWDFGNGYTNSSQGGEISHTYISAGNYKPALLLTDSNGCTINAGITDRVVIHPNPKITVSSNTGAACLGQPVQLTASGAESYSWSPAEGLNNSNTAQPFAMPAQTTTYRVAGTDAHGCSNHTDYTLIVHNPISIQLAPEAEICAGESIMLNVSGADSYRWVNESAGLNNSQSATPVASPEQTTQYTVVGFDPYNCFTDTAVVLVTVNPKPVLNAGDDTEAEGGGTVQLSATGSNDIVKWNWSPANYLSCSNCPSPVSSPQAEIRYTLTATTQKGCETSDEILVKMACGEKRVRIPNAFSPNGDGKNDFFELRGIAVIKHMAIYNRWGNKIFERSNFSSSDPSSCWDGTYKGLPQPTETYVYVVEMQCPAGESFVRKGTITLVR